MTTRYFGAPVPRNEDRRLLTGQALFVDDVGLPGMLHAALLRSPLAHGRVRHIDPSAARRRNGVVAVYTADDLGAYWQPGPLLVPPPPIAGITFNQRTQVPLAKDKVRHVGEPLALVIAQSRHLAEDALAAISFDLGPLPAVTDLELALRAESASVHDDVRGNIAAHVRQRKGGDYCAAASCADLVIRRRFRYDHGAAAPIETRGVVANWDVKAGQLTVWDTTQGPVLVRNGLAQMLGLSERQVRVIAPFVGGGFGPKIMLFYPEEVLLPWAAIKLGRPIKWIEDRREHFVATAHERDQIHDAEIALDRDGRILGIKDEFLHDTGAYDPYGLTVPINSQCTLLGPYVVPSYDSTFTAVFTNNDRHTLSRRRPPARRVRDRAPARHRGARARHRSRRNPSAQFHPDECLSLPERDHLPGLRATRIRQRQLRACARQGAGGDRLQAIPRTRTTAPAGARAHSRYRRRLLRGRHRHRSLRRRQGAGASEWQGQRGDRHRHPGPRPLHQLRADCRRPGRRRRARRRRGHRRHRPV